MYVDPSRKRLGYSVGGHDCSCGIDPVFFSECGDTARQAAGNAIDRERLHDDTGGKRQHLVRRASEQCGHLGACPSRSRDTVLTSPGIRAARIHQQGPDIAAALQIRLCNDHRGRTEAVAGENTGHPGSRCKCYQQQVPAICLAYTGFGYPEAYSFDCQQVGGIGGREFYRHSKVSPIQGGKREPRVTIESTELAVTLLIFLPGTAWTWIVASHFLPPDKRLHLHVGVCFLKRFILVDILVIL